MAASHHFHKGSTRGQLLPRGHRGNNMIRKFVIAAGIAAIAISFASTESFAKKKSHKAKEPKCSAGQMCTVKLDKTGKVTRWAQVKECNYKGKMSTDVFPCYTPSGMCPAATCKSPKKK
jgi:hypothetical protein